MSQENKQVVHYHASKPKYVVLGRKASVYPVDHPSMLVSNTTMCVTSRVISIQGDVFETENTIYKPIEGASHVLCSNG